MRRVEDMTLNITTGKEKFGEKQTNNWIISSDFSPSFQFCSTFSVTYLFIKQQFRIFAGLCKAFPDSKQFLLLIM